MSPFKKRALVSAGLIAGIIATAVAGASETSDRTDTVHAVAAAPAVPVSLTTTSTAPAVAEPAVPVAVPAPTTTPPAAPAAISADTATAAPAVEPEPAPEPEAEPAPAPTGGGSVEDAIATYFGDVYESAIGVAQCESGLNPGAVNGQFRGLFQIGAMHEGLANELGYSWDQMFDPYVNSHVARALYDGSGWQPWSCRWAA